MARTYCQMHRTDKYSEHSSIIWRVRSNDWVFVLELSGSGFESSKGLVKWSSSNDLSCNICRKEDHLPTADPGGIKLIQCFTCKQLLEITPPDQVQLLKKKTLWFQCLFPGAKITDTKHSDGRCERYYACKHPLHDKFPAIKHVLVCAEYIFELYKYMCTLKQKHIQLPGFSREIKLSFHLNQLTTPQI